jgi:azurin
MGMNVGALHALWTLQGLGMLDGSVPAATAVAVAALRHPAAGVRKAALQVLPVDGTTLQRLQSSGLLEDKDPHTRLAALLTLSQLPPSEEVGALLYKLAKAPEVQNDEWLAQAVIASAAKHRAGYLRAYAAEMGDQPYRALAQRIAGEISNPPPPQPAPQAGQPPRPTPPPLPVAERLLRAYVEDVVGPITRPTQAANANNASTDPVLAIEMAVVRGQMKFALPRFTAKPGQRVRITFTNPDDMQHNMLVLRQGTLEAVGALADAMAATPDGAERNYVPPSPDVMAYTPLVDPGKSFTFEFTAPRQTGDYPYVCTFPGHWRVMQGTMTVQ